MDTIPYLDDDTAKKIARDHGTPVYVYDADSLKKRAKEVLAFPNPYGLVARFAVKVPQLPFSALLTVQHGRHCPRGPCCASSTRLACTLIAAAVRHWL